jgi:hypothetical protein
MEARVVSLLPLRHTEAVLKNGATPAFYAMARVHVYLT